MYLMTIPALPRSLAVHQVECACRKAALQAGDWGLNQDTCAALPDGTCTPTRALAACFVANRKSLGFSRKFHED